MDIVMETPDRERALLQQRAASAAAVTNFPGQTPDGRELLASHPHLQQQQLKSSPTSASSDSFSSYIHKDAAIIQHRSSSPRAYSGSHESADGTGAPGSPRSRVQARLDAAALDGHRRLPSFELSRPVQPMRSVSATTPIRGGNFPAAAVVDRRIAHSHESAAVDVSQLRQRPRSQPAHKGETFAHMGVASLYHQSAHEGLAQWEREEWAASVRFTTDSKDEDRASSQRDEGGKGSEIRRRRRTRPDEANLLAQAYAGDAFPDQETRQRLAEQVGMSVRAVSVWFQNRRQAEKKRSGRYGGSGIVGGGLVDGPVTPVKVETSSLDSYSAALSASGSGSAATAARQPLASTPKNADVRQAQVSLPTPIDFSQSNKENVPPWTAADPCDDQQQTFPKLEHEDIVMDSLPRRSASASFGSTSHDLRDLVTAASPDFRQEQQQERPSRQEKIAGHAAAAAGIAVQKRAQSLSRARSAPKVTLQTVLARRASSFRRSATDHGRPQERSSDIEDEEASIILPPRQPLSRSGSASSLSLVTTAGGRASLGSPAMHVARAASTGQGTSLNSRLPPAVTAALQRQGIIASSEEEQAKAKMVWQRMESSSASSSDPDRMHPGGASRKDSEEDEEKTLRIIATRRAVKAQASACVKPAIADADARSAIHQKQPVTAFPADVDRGQPAQSPLRLGLPRCVPSLDWAAGRDRSATKALPQRTISTPLLQAVSRTSTPTFASPAKPEPESSQKAAARRTTSAQAKKSGGAAAVGLPLAMMTPFRGVRPAASASQTASAAVAASLSTTTALAVDATPTHVGTRTSPRKKSAATTPQINDENIFGGIPSSAVHATQGSPKRRRVEPAPEPAPDQEASAHRPMAKPADRVLDSPMFAPRGMMHPHSFPSSSHPSFLSTPRALASSPFNGALSARSERIGYRGLAGSPSATPAPRKLAVPDSARASFDKPRVRSFQSARESSARDQRRPLNDRSTTAVRQVVGSRSPLQDLNDSGVNAASHASDELASHPVKEASSTSTAKRTLSATPSRILTDRSNMSGITMSAERMVPSNRHDDSGFFGSDSEDEEQPLASVVRQKKVLPGPASRWNKSRSSPVVPRKRKGGDAAEDQHAAELLLGLGQTHEAQSQ